MGEAGIWPYADECKRQLEEMGSSALAYAGPNSHKPTLILRAAALLRDLAEI